MNVVKEIGQINKRQLGLADNASWHDQYKNSAYIFAGGLDFDLTEGDVITIFSQYGEVADINMPRDKTTNKPRGFAFLMYEDQRSTVLAVDNLNGAKVLERTLRVDHVDKYKQIEKGEDGKFKDRETQSLNAVPENFMLQNGEASDSDQSSHPSIDPDDPMAAYLLEQARERKKSGKGKKKSKYEGETKEERKERKREKKRIKELEARLGSDARRAAWTEDARDDNLRSDTHRRKRRYSSEDDRRNRQRDRPRDRSRSRSPRRDDDYQRTSRPYDYDRDDEKSRSQTRRSRDKVDEDGDYRSNRREEEMYDRKRPADDRYRDDGKRRYKD